MEAIAHESAHFLFREGNIYVGPFLLAAKPLPLAFGFNLRSQNFFNFWPDFVNILYTAWADVRGLQNIISNFTTFTN